MEFRINKNSELPIYQQLKEQIKYFLLSGTLLPGTRMPTPKDLGIYLQINRNTVIAAYKELEKGGLLMTRQGQGTYVSDNISVSTNDAEKQVLISLAREMLEKTRQLGFTAEDLFTVVFNQTMLGMENPNPKGIRALLVECNQTDLQYFQEILQKELKIQVNGCLLYDLEERMNDENVSNADFIITNFTHIEDVKAILEPLGREVLGILAVPHLQVFMQMSQFAPGSKVALICCAQQGSKNMKRITEAAGIRHIDLEACGFENSELLDDLLQRADYIVCSGIAIKGVKAAAPSNAKIIEFFTELDMAGIEMLKKYIDRKMQEKNEEARMMKIRFNS